MANAEIKVGDFGGVVVHEQDDKYVVELNTFENSVIQQFKGKVKNEFYSSYLNDGSIKPKPNHSLLAIPKKHLTTESQIRDFNYRVSEGSKLSAEIQADYTNIQSIVNIDTVGKKVWFNYGQTIKVDKSDSKETNVVEKNDWAYGDVVARNKNYVAISTGENESTKFVLVLKTEKFLMNKDELANAENILNERLKKGEHIKLKWIKPEGDKKDIKILVQPADPLKKSIKKEQTTEVVKDVANEKATQASQSNAVEEGKAVQAKRSRKKEQSLAA